MTDQRPWLLLSPYITPEDSAGDIPGATVIRASCGHKTWISPQGRDYLLETPEAVTVCLACRPRPEDVRRYTVVPRAREALNAAILQDLLKAVRDHK